MSDETPYTRLRRASDFESELALYAREQACVSLGALDALKAAAWLDIARKHELNADVLLNEAEKIILHEVEETVQ